jgi:hypothetical protein
VPSPDPAVMLVWFVIRQFSMMRRNPRSHGKSGLRGGFGTP